VFITALACAVFTPCEAANGFADSQEPKEIWMNIYVENLSPKTSKWQIRMAFERYGQVGKIRRDKSSANGDACDSCVLEMLFDNQAALAIRELNGSILGGHTLVIKKSTVCP
jgi:RNA recognition motif-containing protein